MQEPIETEITHPAIRSFIERNGESHTDSQHRHHCQTCQELFECDREDCNSLSPKTPAGWQPILVWQLRTQVCHGCSYHTPDRIEEQKCS